MARHAKRTETIEERAVPGEVASAIAALRERDTADRLLGLYDLGLEACARGNALQVDAAIEELITTLDFTYGEIAEGFERLYRYCLDQSAGGGFERVAFVLRDLRDTLASAARDAAGEPGARAS